ncbi:MAG: DegV family protein, partial [Anaerolineales bacterium]
MKLGIVTDSTCDLPQTLVNEYGVEVVPCILILDEQEFADGAGLTREEFYRRLPDFKRAPTTAAPSIGAFAVRYQKLMDQGCDQVISIHAAGLLTSMIDTARQAADEFPGRVTVVDSLSLSLGLGFQVLAAAEAAQEPEADVHEALAAIESTRRRLHLFAALDTLEYVRRSGRVPAAITILGSILSIKPVIELTEGQVKVVGAVRTRKQANERMLAFMRQGGKLDRLAILHTGAEPRARELLNRLMMEMSQA